MSLIRYTGYYDPLARGKYLLEILAQLKNFGVGRMVVKHEWLRKFPSQPSYLVIRKVEPQMDRWLWKGKVYGDWTFRGRPLGLHLFRKQLDRADWRLVHVEEEARFNEATTSNRVSLTAPSRIPLPPMLRYLEQRKSSPKLSLPALSSLDPEHECLKEFVTLREDKSAPDQGSIYNIDPTMYLQYYGEELPLRIEDWTCPTLKRSV